MARSNEMMKIYFILLAFCCVTVASAEITTGPIAFLKSHDAVVQGILVATPDTLHEAEQEKIKTHINAAFDFPELSRLALGEHWEQRTAGERAHFTETFSGIISEQNFDSFLRYYREGNITYQSETIENDKAVVTAAVPLKREQVEIVYKMHLVQNAWRVYDLVIDGVSTAEGNRRRYARYIEKKSYKRLIAQLDKQLNRLLQTRK